MGGQLSLFDQSMRKAMEPTSQDKLAVRVPLVRESFQMRGEDRELCREAPRNPLTTLSAGAIVPRDTQHVHIHARDGEHSMDADQPKRSVIHRSLA